MEAIRQFESYMFWCWSYQAHKAPRVVSRSVGEMCYVHKGVKECADIHLWLDSLLLLNGAV